MIRPVILSGGSGTRLWPLSTHARPKQFADLIPGGPSLFGATISRLAGVAGTAPPIVVSGVDHLGLVRAEAATSGVEPMVVIVEPMGRNTAPAVAAAALLADSEDVLVILPSDHLIGDTGAFQDGVGTAVGHALSGSIVAFGVTPTRAETGYGYIETGDSVGDGWQVARFKEKPAVEEAGEMMSDGRHLWNSGMFVAMAGVLIDEMAATCPAILEGVRGAVPTSIEGLAVLGPSFATVEAISFDHAVMERTGRAVVIPLDVGWDDIGSYQALMGLSAKDGEGNAVSGPVILENVTGSFIHATTRTVAVAGMSDVIVVEAADGVLVVSLSEAQRVKDLAERAQKQG